MVRRNIRNRKKMLNLDQKHLHLLKDPKSIRNKTLFLPEGYANDLKHELEIFSQILKVNLKINTRKYLNKLHLSHSGARKIRLIRKMTMKFQILLLDSWKKKPSNT